MRPAVVAFLILVGCADETAGPAPDAAAGGDATADADHSDLTDAADGTGLTDAADGTGLTDGTDGTDPTDGTEGTDLTDGTDGTSEGTDGDGTDATDGTGETDSTDATGGECDDVCFELFEPEPLPGTAPGEPVEVEWTACNPTGIPAGTCPEGSTCTGPVALTPSPLVTVTQPLCLPDTRAVTLVTDLAPPPPGEHEVALAFLLDGTAWPLSSGAAGALRLTPASGGPPVEVALPNGPPGELELMLDAGIYDAELRLYGDDFDASTWPTGTLLGVLEVVEDGSAIVDVPAVSVPVSIEVDGAPVQYAPGGGSVTLTLRGETHTPTVTVAAGEAVPAALALRPEPYEVTVVIAGGDDLPSGGFTLEVDAALPAATIEVVTSTLAVSGTVVVDGKDLPSSQNRGSVRFEDGTGTATAIPVGMGTPATFTGTVLAGTYDVFYDTTAAFMPGIPSGLPLVASGWAAGPELDVSLTTILAAGTVTLNGETPPEGPGRGTVTFSGGGSLGLKSTGEATFFGAVFDVAHRVTLSSDGTVFPPGAVLAESFEPDGVTDLLADVEGWPVTVTVLVNGAPPEEQAVGARALLRALRAGEDGVESATATFPAKGAVTTTLVLPPGTWHFGLTSLSEVLPAGGAFLGSYEVDGPQTVPVDLETRTVTYRLTDAGEPPPEAGLGMDRGWLVLTGIAASADATIPASGPAEVTLTLFAGVYDVLWMCRVELGCDPEVAPALLTITDGLDLR